MQDGLTLTDLGVMLIARFRARKEFTPLGQIGLGPWSFLPSAWGGGHWLGSSARLSPGQFPAIAGGSGFGGPLGSPVLSLGSTTVYSAVGWLKWN